MQTEAKPITDSKRTAIVDILRGWAILGVAIGNYTDYYYFEKHTGQTADIASKILMGVHGIFFAAKSWTMLSVLFGYGFAVVMNNIAEKGKNPVAFFSRRMFWLFVIAFVNSAFWFGDILKDYAILGLVLLLFYKCSGKTAFITGLALLAILPFVAALVPRIMPFDYAHARDTYYLPQLYSTNWLQMFWAQLKGTYYLEILSPSYAINVHIMMFACMLFGFAAQKFDVFNRLPELRKQVKTTFWASLAGGILVTIGVGMMYQFKLPLMRYINPYYWSVACIMVMILTGICWLYINGKLKGFCRGMQAMGKMTLTNYITQNILAVLIFLNVGLGLNTTYAFWFYFGAAVAVFIIQIFVSRWWLKYYNYGPVEWLWRQASYGKRLPIKKQQTS